eukprot:TRINITY_DN2657_c1_g1_i1.p1 TRINITY_DN2657_c1_g1~~TRINITY_DN2657_c1_g1_i1.p1  ORF type:complete len:901 (+),score=354.17 TRINITY_DN2657_c1_g1_i1:216-2918(+)
MEKYQREIVACFQEVISASENITKAFPKEIEFADLIMRACRMAQQASHDFNDSFQDYNQTGWIEVKWMKEAADKIEAIMSQLVRVVISGSFEQKYPELSSSITKPQEEMIKQLNGYRSFLDSAAINQLNRRPTESMSKTTSFLNSSPSKEESNAFFKDMINVASPVALFWQYAERNRQEKPVLAPSERSDVVKQLCELPLWILDLALKERDSRIESQAESVKRGLALDAERNSIRSWKAETLASFKDALELEGKKEDQEAIQRRLEATVVLKDVEIKELDGRLAELERKDMEMEQRYRMAKEALTKYMIEVEEWKRESSAKFTRYLTSKDKEIADLKNVIMTTMNKDEKEIAKMKESVNSYMQTQSVYPISNGNSTSNNQNPPPIPTRSERTITTSAAGPPVPPKPKESSWMRATKLFKVQLPFEMPPLTLEYREHTTLEIILGEIKEWLQRNPNPMLSPDNLSDFSFYHVEGSETGNVIPLNYTVGSLRFSTVRFGPKASRIKSTKPLGEIIESIQTDVNTPMRRETVQGGSALVVKCFGYDIEVGDPKNVPVDEASRSLTDIDKNTPYYSHYFKSRNHINFYSEGTTKIGPIIVSLEVPSKEQKELYQDNNIQLRALVRTKFDEEWVFISADAKNKKKALQKALETDLRSSDKLTGVKLREVTGNGSVEILTNLEDRLQTKGYKFGVLYVKSGQTDENKMFQNLHKESSQDYIEFLNFLGDIVALKGFEGFRGGLDVKGDTTGTHSIAVKHAGFQIMFHVATLLPYFPNDQQQLERKRHLGNDVVVLVFKDSEDQPFNPSTIKSEFNHVFVVFCKDKSRTDGKTSYKLSLAYKGVGISTPMLPYPSNFEATPSFRDFLFTKLINSERSAMYAPSFVTKMQKTKELQMLDVLDKLKEIS